MPGVAITSLVSQTNYTGFYSITDSTFWSVDKESGIINCDRGCVRKICWFTITDDKNSGKKLIQSSFNGKYAEVRDDGFLYASQTRPVLSTQFDIDLELNAIKSVYSKKYIHMHDGKVYADSAIPVPLEFFDLKTIAIADYDLIVYGAPGTYSGKNAILFNSATPYPFVLITKLDGSASYLQIEENQYVQPISTTEPVSYLKKRFSKANYRLEIIPYKEETNIFNIKAGTGSLNRYFQLSDMETNNTPLLVLFSNGTNGDIPSAKFNIILTR